MHERLLKIQEEIGAIKKDSQNPHFKNTYFDINSLLNAVKPVINKHGVILLQPLVHIDGKLAIETILLEAEGSGRFSTICPLPDGLTAQQAGAAITYFRRYALTSMLAIEAEDMDGEHDSFSSVGTTNETPVTNIRR